jgi:hypothetical protein
MSHRALKSNKIDRWEMNPCPFRLTGTTEPIGMQTRETEVDPFESMLLTASLFTLKNVEKQFRTDIRLQAYAGSGPDCVCKERRWTCAAGDIQW